MVMLMSEQFNKHLFHHQPKYKQLLLVIFNLSPKQFTNRPTPQRIPTAQLKGYWSLLVSRHLSNQCLKGIFEEVNMENK